MILKIIFSLAASIIRFFVIFFFINSSTIAEEEISVIVNRFSKLTAKKILNVGLHEFLLRFIRDLYSVNSNLQNNYFFGKEK